MKAVMVCQENPGNRLSVKESDFPLEILYNQEMNAQKMIEKNFSLKNKPI